MISIKVLHKLPRSEKQVERMAEYMTKFFVGFQKQKRREIS